MRRALAFLLPFGLVLSPLAACGSDDKVGKGGECSLATDCAPGLICIPQKDTRVCSDDLSNVAGKPPPDGGAAEAGEGGDADLDQLAPDDRTTPMDTGTPDTSKPDTGPADASDAG